MSDACTVWWARPSDGRGLVHLLAPHEQSRALRLPLPGDRARYVSSRALVRFIVADQLGCSMSAVAVQQRCIVCGSPDHGPLQLPGAELTVSVSHTEARIGVAVAGGQPVGLDVESCPGRKDPRDLVEVALTAHERSIWEQFPADARPEAALRWWTRKESVLKATGWGLALPPDQISVTSPDRPPALLGWQARFPAAPPAEQVHVHDLNPGSGHIGNLTVFGSDLDVIEHETDLTAIESHRC